jgi:hypothetical protein
MVWRYVLGLFGALGMAACYKGPYLLDIIADGPRGEFVELAGQEENS